MTLHCNKVELWPCPEYIAKMCVHSIEIPQYTNRDTTTYTSVVALERYLIWVENQYLYEIHKQEVLDVMKDPDLKVWLE